jgi:hypothetical protein
LLTGWSSGATSTPDEPNAASCGISAGNSILGTVWYKFTATSAAMNMSFVANDADDQYINIYDGGVAGTCPGAASAPIYCYRPDNITNRTGEVFASSYNNIGTTQPKMPVLTVGNTYYIGISTWSDGVSDFYQEYCLGVNDTLTDTRSTCATASTLGYYQFVSPTAGTAPPGTATQAPGAATLANSMSNGICNNSGFVDVINEGQRNLTDCFTFRAVTNDIRLITSSYTVTLGGGTCTNTVSNTLYDNACGQVGTPWAGGAAWNAGVNSVVGGPAIVAGNNYTICRTFTTFNATANTECAPIQYQSYLLYNGVPSTLPITLSDFYGIQFGSKKISLNWTTMLELNTYKFIIERSTNGSVFKQIGEVKANGNSSQTIKYTFDDTNLPSGKVYYRLKVVDVNTAFEYSKILEFFVENNNVVINNAYPNPTTGNVNVDVFAPVSSNVKFSVVDIVGRTLQQFNKSLLKGNNTFNIDLSNNVNGIYFIKAMETNTNTESLIKIVKH